MKPLRSFSDIRSFIVTEIQFIWLFRSTCVDSKELGDMSDRWKYTLRKAFTDWKKRSMRQRKAATVTVLCGMTATLLLSAPSVQAQSAAAARRIFDLTNQDRQLQGLPPLAWDVALARSAQAHARWMVREPELSHQYPGEASPLDRAAAAGAHFRAMAENIATGPGAEAIEREWMHSPHHRRNILDPRMDALGVAVAERDGTLYAVEDFAEVSQSLRPDQVANRVKALLRPLGVDPSAPAGEAEAACRMSSGMPRGTRARSLVRFQTPDLSRLPAQVAEQVRRGGFARAAVAACAPEGGQTEFTLYRVAILFY